MIYIMRHGQTNRNKAQRLSGRQNVALNEEGRAQARRTGNYFKDHHIAFDQVYSSPLDRAIETAEISTGIKRDQIITDDLLLEMDYGPYEGVSLDHPPAEIVYFFADFVHHPAPAGMESLDHVVARLGKFLEGLPYRNDENILISTHAIAMKGALEYCTPNASGQYWSKYIGNCAVYCFDRIDGQFTIPEELELS